VLKKEDDKDMGMRLVNADGDRFWELGDCISEFPGDRKKTNFVVER